MKKKFNMFFIIISLLIPINVLGNSNNFLYNEYKLNSYIEIYLNIDESNNRLVKIDNIDVSINEDIWNFYIKQSEINKIINIDDKNILDIATLYINYSDFLESNYVLYSYDNGLNYYYHPNNDIFNLFSIDVSLSELDNTYSLGKNVYLYNGNLINDKDDILKEELINEELLLELSPNIKFNIIEDEKRDYKNVEKIVSLFENENGIIEKKEEKISLKREDVKSLENRDNKITSAIIISLFVFTILLLIILLINKKIKK